MPFSRRDFVKTSVLGAVAAGVGTRAQGEDAGARTRSRNPDRTSVRSYLRSQRIQYLDNAFAFLKSGGDTLDAALKVVKGPEDDPNEPALALAAFPMKKAWSNSMPAACTARRGARDRSEPYENQECSLVSKAVMDHTGHVMLVGEGAERFAVAVGFPRENLLTDHSRKIWLLWKEYPLRRRLVGAGPGRSRTGRGRSRPKSRSREAGKNVSSVWKSVQLNLGIAPELRAEAVHKVLFPPKGRFTALR